MMALDLEDPLRTEIERARRARLVRAERTDLELPEDLG